MIPMPRPALASDKRPRMMAMALTGALLLGGCAGKPTRPATSAPPAQAPASPAPGAPSQAAPARPSSAVRPPAASRGSNATAAPSPEATGVPACDEYLASYKGCHRAAGIFAPDQLEDRYQAMRTSLLRDSRDPKIRPQLAARCNSLARQLREALHGKPCEAESEPAPASSTP